MQEKQGKQTKNSQRNDLLHGFKLEWRETFFLPKYIVGRHHEHIFEKCNTPADQYQLDQRCIPGILFQVTVPCIGHKTIGSQQAKDRAHMAVLKKLKIKNSMPCGKSAYLFNQHSL
jgi:hypothetical protein